MVALLTPKEKALVIYNKYRDIIKEPVSGQKAAWGYNREKVKNCAIAEVDSILNLPQLDNWAFEFYSQVKTELETYNKSGYGNIF